MFCFVFCFACFVLFCFFACFVLLFFFFNRRHVNHTFSGSLASTLPCQPFAGMRATDGPVVSCSYFVAEKKIRSSSVNKKFGPMNKGLSGAHPPIYMYSYPLAATNLPPSPSRSISELKRALKPFIFSTTYVGQGGNHDNYKYFSGWAILNISASKFGKIKDLLLLRPFDILK